MNVIYFSGFGAYSGVELSRASRKPDGECRKNKYVVIQISFSDFKKQKKCKQF